MKISKYCLLEIGREKGASLKVQQGLNEEIINKLLIEALPLGNPEDHVFKIISIEGEIYLSFLSLSPSEDYGLALVIVLDEELKELNPFGFIKNISEILESLVKKKDAKLPKELEIKYKSPEHFIDNYENFDAFIFSLLTQQQSLIVGEEDDLWKFLAGLFEFIPTELKKYLSLIANSTSFNNSVQLHALRMKKDVLKILDEKKGEFTILFLPSKIAYSNFTADFCKKIAKLFVANEKETIKQELMEFFSKTMKSKDLPSIADFAAEEQLSLSDASLMLWMRANYFEIEVPQEITEGVIKR